MDGAVQRLTHLIHHQVSESFEQVSSMKSEWLVLFIWCKLENCLHCILAGMLSFRSIHTSK